MRVPWSVMWVITGAVASIVISTELRAVSMPARTTVVLVATVVLGAAMLLAADRECWSPTDTMPAMLHLGLCCVLADAAWIVGFDLAADPTWRWMTGMGMLTAGELGAIMVVTHIQTRRRRRGPPSSPGDPLLDDQLLLVKSALHRARLGHLQPVSWIPLPDPTDPSRSIGMSYSLRIPADQDPPDAGAARRLATALSEIMRTPLDTRWVQLREESLAGLITVTVTLRNTVADVVPYQDVLEWTTITEPAPLAVRPDGTLFCLKLNRHGGVVGSTGGGKSAMLHVMLAFFTRCRDAIVWVCGAEKVYELVAGWVDPYEGSDYRLPIDWIMKGPQGVAGMLYTAMIVGRWRQDQPMSERAGWPRIVIILDESSFALRNRDIRLIYDGREVTMSQLAGMISQGLRSAGIYLIRATQRSTHDHGGLDAGGDIAANDGYSITFMSSDNAETGRVTGNYRLATPWEPGQCWVRATGLRQPECVKGLYIQDVDPDAPVLHNGLTVADVAWSRRHFPRSLDAGSAAAAGPVYAHRQTTMTPEMRRYLNGTSAPIQEPQERSREIEVSDASEVMVPTGVHSTHSSVIALTRPQTLAQRVMDIIENHAPVSRSDIVQRLDYQGTGNIQQMVTNALTKLKDEDRIIQPASRMYAPQGWVPPEEVRG